VQFGAIAAPASAVYLCLATWAQQRISVVAPLMMAPNWVEWH
jgi:hypothetical protein